METISVREYADIKGISVQAVYRKIKTPLFQPYIRQDTGGETRLAIEILEDQKINRNSLKHKPLNQQKKELFTTVESELLTTVDNQPKAPDSGHTQEKQGELLTTEKEELLTTVDNTSGTVESTPKQPQEATESPLEKELRNRVQDKDQEIKRLVEQLSAKDEQIRAKDEQIKSLQESLQAAQMIQAKQMQIQIPDKAESVSAENKGFFARLRSWWNSTTPQQ